MIYYDRERKTLDVDCQLNTIPSLSLDEIDVIQKQLRNYNIAIDLTEDISRWSLIDLPKEYPRRKIHYKRIGNVSFFILAPLDLLISKLRVGRNQDIEDCMFLVKKFSLKRKQIKEEAEKVIKSSPKSTEIFKFKKIVDFFLERMK